MNVIEEYKLTRQRLFDATGIQPQSKIVSTNGQVKNIHYLELGSGKPLILVHGGGGHSGDLISIMKPLAEHFHLYVVDRPGCRKTFAYQLLCRNDHRSTSYVAST